MLWLKIAVQNFKETIKVEWSFKGVFSELRCNWMKEDATEKLNYGHDGYDNSENRRDIPKSHNIE